MISGEEELKEILENPNLIVDKLTLKQKTEDRNTSMKTFITYIVLSAMLICVLSIALIIERKDTSDRAEFDVWLKQLKEANKDLVNQVN